MYKFAFFSHTGESFPNSIQSFACSIHIYYWYVVPLQPEKKRTYSRVFKMYAATTIITLTLITILLLVVGLAVCAVYYRQRSTELTSGLNDALRQNRVQQEEIDRLQRLLSKPEADRPVAEPTAEPSALQKLFHRLCQLMDGPELLFVDSELDRSRLAKLLATNEHYVSDAVSACTNGGSITDFLNGYRLRYAVHLLTTTNESIGLIAELSGFSRRSFYRIFDEAYSMSPSDYRKAMK